MRRKFFASVILFSKRHLIRYANHKNPQSSLYVFPEGVEPLTQSHYLRGFEVFPATNLNKFIIERRNRYLEVTKHLGNSFTDPRLRQSLANLVELIENFSSKMYDLQIARASHNPWHNKKYGISQEGQFEIYAGTLTFYDSFYSVLSYLAGFVQENRKVFPHAKTSSITAFLSWIQSEGFPLLDVGGPLRRAYDFRSLAVHQNGKSPLNWDTLTLYNSPVFVVLRALGNMPAGRNLQYVKFQNGDGWCIASPNEEFVTLLTLDLNIWLLSKVSKAISDSPEFEIEDLHFLEMLESHDLFRFGVSRILPREAIDSFIAGQEFYLN